MHTGENFMLLIQNSYLIDPASGTEGRRDILIDHGRFVKIDKHLMAPAGASVLDLYLRRSDGQYEAPCRFPRNTE